MIKSITNLDYFKINDPSSQQTYYGANQEWYPKKWQRLSGCGPTVASHIFFYLSQPPTTLEGENRAMSKEDWVLLMEQMWRYVTPSLRGVHKTEMFYEPLLDYLKVKGLNAKYHVFDVPKEKSQRSNFAQLRSFLEEALLQDAPIAFLNLCNGEVKNLDRWHWVTIVSLNYFEEGDITKVQIMDAGRLITIDLALWYETTTLGGGFLYFV